MNEIKNGHVLLSAMAGVNTGYFVSEVIRLGADGAILGGITLDMETTLAAMNAMMRGRHEFITNIEDIPRQVKLHVEKNVKIIRSKYPRALIGINVRAATPDSLVQNISKIIKQFDFVEINAHCRQKEFTRIGIGQELSKNVNKLEPFIEQYKSSFKVPLSVKLRGHVLNVNLISKMLNKYEVEIAHVDAMSPGSPRANLKIIKDFARTYDGHLIGNNSIIDPDSALAMINAGARSISIARMALIYPGIFKEIKKQLRGMDQ